MALSLRPVLWDAHMTVVLGGGFNKLGRKSPAPEFDDGPVRQAVGARGFGRPPGLESGGKIRTVLSPVLASHRLGFARTRRHRPAPLHPEFYFDDCLRAV